MKLDEIQNFIEKYPAFFLALTIWTLIWKGLALWKASQKSEKLWFGALLVLNTFGILEIIYYYFINKKSDHLANSTDSSSE